MSFRTILMVSYFGLSLALIIWSEVVSRTQSELGIFGMGLFGVLTFPSSYLVGSVASILSSSFGPMASPAIESRFVTGVILIAGFFQWFYLAPWIFQKIRGLF